MISIMGKTSDPALLCSWLVCPGIRLKRCTARPAAWGGAGPWADQHQATAVQGFARLNVMRTCPAPLFASNAVGRLGDPQEKHSA